MPAPRALALGRALGWFYGSVIRYHRRDAFDALQQSLPATTEREQREIVRNMYAGLGMNIIEFIRLLNMSREDILGGYIAVEGEDNIREALGRNRGVLVLTGHIGCWDLLCAVTPQFGYPLTVITKRIKQEAVHRLWLHMRNRFGVNYLPAQQAYRSCLKVLRKNELVGFILDQNMIDKEGVFVEFFGRPACTSPGLAYLAAQAQAPIVPIFIERRPDSTHMIHIQPLIEPPPDRQKESIIEATQTYTRTLEEYIRQHPSDWIWIHRRWRTRPPEQTTNPA